MAFFLRSMGRNMPAVSHLLNRAYSTGSPVLLEYPDGKPEVAIVSLNRPEQLNALNLDTLYALSDTFQSLQKNPSTKAIVLTGKGKAFCAGIDLTTAADIFQGKANIINSERDPVLQMNRTKVPIIGAIHGFAITGGFELALNCDFLIGTPEAKFMDTHAKFGIHPSWGLSQLLARFVGLGRAKEISLTANPVDAATAHQWGLLNRIVPEAELLPTAVALASAIAKNVPELIQLYKPLIDQSEHLGLEDGRELERQNASKYYKSMTPEAFAKMQAFIASRSKGKN